MDTQTKLWRAWKDHRDESAFEALVRPELPALYDAARRAGLTPADAEDVVQDALAALATEGSQRPGRVGIGAWLMRTVRFRALTARRSAGRRRRHEASAPEPRDRTPAEDDVRDELETALDRLPDDDRQILLLRFSYDLEYREIAYVLGVSENACRIRVHRATSKLRDLLGPRATAFLAAVPLGDLPGTSEAIATAIHSVGAKSGLALLIGGVIVSQGVKMATVAVVAAALTAGVFLVVDDSNEDVPITTSDVLDSTEPETEFEPEAPILTGRMPEMIAELDPDDEEVLFLRKALAEERERRTAATVKAGDSGLDILTAVFEHGMDPWPVMSDFDAFQSHVQRGPVEPHVLTASRDAPLDVDLTQLPEGVHVFEFGPGTYNVTGMRRFRSKEPIAHVEFRGAGRDETTLLMGAYDEIMVTAALEHLRFSDMTIDYANQRSFLSVRDRVAVIAEDVRFKDWHSWLMIVSGSAYVGCRNCEFINSDGRGGGWVIGFRGPSLAVYDRCYFEGIDSAVIASTNGKGGRARFADCTFEDSRLTDSRITATTKAPMVEIRVERGQATYGDANLTDEQRRERFGLTFVASVADFTVSPTVRNVTLGQVVDVLQAIDVPRDEEVFSIQMTGWKDGQPSAFQVCTQPEGAERTKVYTALHQDHRWVLRHEAGAGGPGYWVWPDLPRPLPILVAIDKSGLDRDTPATGVGIQRFGMDTSPKKQRLNFYALGSMPNTTYIDASTGKAMTWDDLKAVAKR